MKVKCDIGEVALLESDILYISIDKNLEVEEPHIRQIKSVVGKMINSKVYSIINYGAFCQLTKEAREACIREMNSSVILARAFVVNDLGQMIVAKHCYKTKNEGVPTGIFTTYEEARLWIDSIRTSRMSSNYS